MTLTVVVGGQYGSEGKGKIVSYLACQARRPVAVVRCGGSNAGHTAAGNGIIIALRQLPSGTVAEHCQLYLAPGMLIELPTLISEIKQCRVSPQRLRIDRNAALIAESDRQREIETCLRGRIGSTLSGTGAATARKVLRESGLALARDVPELRSYIDDVAMLANNMIDEGGDVIVEGSQGFGLSLHHVDSYPYVTSRDTTAAAFLSEAGLSPRRVTDIIMVLRSYPIRVAGASGPLPNEISWDTVTRESGYPRPLAEYTTVTKALRRVAHFDWELAERAVRINQPTMLALHGADYVAFEDYGKRSWTDLSDKTKHVVSQIEDRLGVLVAFIFTGPGESDIVDRRAELSLSTQGIRELVLQR